MPTDEKESGWELHRRQPLYYQQAISESNTPEKQAFEPAEMVANIPVLAPPVLGSARAPGPEPTPEGAEGGEAGCMTACALDFQHWGRGAVALG